MSAVLTSDSAAAGPSGPSAKSGIGGDYSGTLTETTSPGSTDEKSGTIAFSYSNQNPAVPHLLAHVMSANGSTVSGVECSIDGKDGSATPVAGASGLFDCGKVDEHQTATISLLLVGPSTGYPQATLQLLGGEDASMTGATNIVALTVGGK